MSTLSLHYFLEMPLHYPASAGHGFYVVRVPGGWIYAHTDASDTGTFVALPPGERGIAGTDYIEPVEAAQNSESATNEGAR